MIEKKRLFRWVLDSLIEGRRRQAQRFVDDYMKTRDLHRPTKD